MRPRNVLGSALGLVLLASAPVRADYTAITIDGPGGSGFTNPSGSAALFDITYSQVDYADIHLTVNSAGTYDLHTAFSDIHILNVTGSTWTAFTFAALDGVTFQNAFENHAPHDYAAVTVDPVLVTFSGGDGVNNSNFFFYPTLTFTAPSAGTFGIRATPLLGAVPEPSSLALLALGGFALAGRLARPGRSI